MKSLKDLAKKKSHNSQELQDNFLDYLHRELETYRLYPLIIDPDHIGAELPNDIEVDIVRLINNSFKKIDEIIEIQHKTIKEPITSLFRDAVKYFTLNIIQDEYDLILNLMQSINQRKIEGKYLSLNRNNLELVLKEQQVKFLIRSTNSILNIIVHLYKDHNSEWLSEYMRLGRSIDTHVSREQLLEELEKNNPYLASAIRYKDECIKIGKRQSMNGLAKSCDMAPSTFKERLEKAGVFEQIKELLQKKINKK